MASKAEICLEASRLIKDFQAFRKRVCGLNNARGMQENDELIFGELVDRTARTLEATKTYLSRTDAACGMADKE